MKPGRELPVDPFELCQAPTIPDATGFSEEYFPGGVKLVLGVSEPTPPGEQVAVANGTQGEPAARSNEDRLHETKPLQSWVVWLKDGRYSYAWGETQGRGLGEIG